VADAPQVPGERACVRVGHKRIDASGFALGGTFQEGCALRVTPLTREGALPPKEIAPFPLLVSDRGLHRDVVRHRVPAVVLAALELPHGAVVVSGVLLSPLELRTVALAGLPQHVNALLPLLRLLLTLRSVGRGGTGCRLARRCRLEALPPTPLVVR
jgi:hypothetical protein